MKRSLASSALPSIQLTLDEKLAVVSQVSTVLDRNLALEADFRRHGCVVDKNEWKEVKTTPNVRVYKQARMLKRQSSSMDFHATLYGEGKALGLNSAETEHSSTETFTSSASIDESFMNQFLCTGQVDGQIEDVLLGAFGGSDMACKERSAYIKDRFEESRILATIDATSAFEPSRFLGIKWYTTGYPRALGRFMSKRDALVIEATGISVDTNGKQYGYYLLHDYYHPSLPELTDHSNIRQKLSLCLLSRPVTPDHVALYVRGRCDVDGDLL